MLPSSSYAAGLSSLHCPMNGAATAPLMIAAVAFDQAALTVRVLRAHPVGQGLARSVLASALRRRVEIAIDAEKLFTAAPVGRIGVEDLTGVVLEKHAVAGEVLEPGIYMLEVVE